jgi:twitching motility protein PilU
MVKNRGSDLFITAEFPPAVKVDGKITPVSQQPLNPTHALTLVCSIMNERQTKEFEDTRECNFAIAVPDVGRFRVSAFIQQGRAAWCCGPSTPHSIGRRPGPAADAA